MSASPLLDIWAELGPSTSPAELSPSPRSSPTALPQIFNWTGGTLASSPAPPSPSMPIPSQHPLLLKTGMTLSTSAASPNNGSITLNGGAIAPGTGPLTNNSTISGFGTIGGSGAFTNNVLLSSPAVPSTSPPPVPFPTPVPSASTPGEVAPTSPVPTALTPAPSTCSLASILGNRTARQQAGGSISGRLHSCPLRPTPAQSCSPPPVPPASPPNSTNAGTISLTKHQRPTSPAAPSPIPTPLLRHGEPRQRPHQQLHRHHRIHRWHPHPQRRPHQQRYRSPSHLAPKLLVASRASPLIPAHLPHRRNLRQRQSTRSTTPARSRDSAFSPPAASPTTAPSRSPAAFSTINGNVTNSTGKTLNIKYNPAIFTGNITNNGTIKTTSTTVTFTGNYTGNTFITDPATQYLPGQRHHHPRRSHDRLHRQTGSSPSTPSPTTAPSPTAATFRLHQHHQHRHLHPIRPRNPGPRAYLPPTPPEPPPFNPTR